MFAFCIAIVYQQIQSEQAIAFSTGALLNVTEVCVAHILLFRFYEHSRSSAYKQLRMRNEQIIALSQTDNLTQLFNRDKLDESLKTLTQISQVTNQALSVIILDIEHLKKINDEYGHLEGDKVLSEFSATLNTLMRKQDLLVR